MYIFLLGNLSFVVQSVHGEKAIGFRTVCSASAHLTSTLRGTGQSRSLLPSFFTWPPGLFALQISLLPHWSPLLSFLLVPSLSLTLLKLEQGSVGALFFFFLFFSTCSPGISLSLVLKAFICQASEFIYVSSLGFFPALAFQAVNSAQNSLPPDICMAFFSPFSGLCQDVIFSVRPTLTTLWKTTDLSL